MIEVLKVQSSYKHEGSTLLVAIIVAAMLLTLGIGAANMLVKDVALSSDLVLSEKAYFAAESGVEKALLDLNSNPVQHQVDSEIDIDAHTKIFLNVENKVSEFQFELAPDTSRKFRLLLDGADDAIYAPEPIETFALDVVPHDKPFQWKILCRDKNDSSNTVSLVAQEKSRNFSDFFAHSHFSTWNEADKASCFFSAQNLSDKPLEFHFSTSTFMAPHKAKVSAKGVAGDREKYIVFDYYQKNLGALFDFVLFHTDKGL